MFEELISCALGVATAIACILAVAIVMFPGRA
ncbi:hypothetical protein NCLIV_067420 [Neospora caninum Liverpool]|uniref:Uncharacterized protein n=1 Tax=Neospora caninum (strain Liverpool) TaxID=572307 RepID=F0VRG9_NEOCL|nr:hypothetical protein NCLIV_067420 [Neospora caninum Liverpool]CBZ56317.1 hypothetical protein NCLIV_067420 [Neospora caninum Liverpool]CEL71077.1 TPA: hypothetical protein BN1204_067420 [Neospora caninum Liverpool]|eukprot:XP_003886342.1 hypothetical protein NCLIV_067420 [Neospora caninum Liverpool]